MLKETAHLEHTAADERLILKWIVEKLGGCVLIVFCSE
jgi:hypothetical protein